MITYCIAIIEKPRNKNQLEVNHFRKFFFFPEIKFLLEKATAETRMYTENQSLDGFGFDSFPMPKFA